MPQVTCPVCFQIVQAPEGSVGKQARCPACREIFTIPEPAAEAPPPAAKPAAKRYLPHELWCVVGADGSEKGPFSGEQLKQAFSLGKIAATTNVRRSDQSYPQPLSTSGIIPAKASAADDLETLPAAASANPYLATSLPPVPPVPSAPLYGSPSAPAAPRRKFWDVTWPLFAAYGGCIVARMVVVVLVQALRGNLLGAVVYAMPGCCELVISSLVFSVGLLGYYLSAQDHLPTRRSLKTQLWVMLLGEQGALMVGRIFALLFVAAACFWIVLNMLAGCLAGPINLR